MRIREAMRDVVVMLRIVFAVQFVPTSLSFVKDSFIYVSE
jgi:hypothetical protein